MLLSILAAAAVQTATPPAPPAKPAAPPNSVRAFACQTTRPLPTPVQQAPVGKAPKTTPWGVPSFHFLGQEPDAAMLRPVLRINHCNDDDVLLLNVSERNAPQQRGR